MSETKKVAMDAFGNPITVCKCPTCGAPAWREEVDGAYDSHTTYKHADIDNARWFKFFAMPIGELTRCLPSWFAEDNTHILDAVKKLVTDAKERSHDESMADDDANRDRAS